MNVLGSEWLPTPIAMPKKPPPEAPDPRWESVYATIEKEEHDGPEAWRVTIHLTLGSHDFHWFTLVSWQDPWRMYGGWPRILDRIVHNVHLAAGFADADQRLAADADWVHREAMRTYGGPPPSLLEAYDRAHDPFYDDHLRRMAADLAAERDKPRDRDLVVITGV